MDGIGRRGVLVGLASLAGCGRFPRDADGALERIERERVVRAGAVVHAPWVQTTGQRIDGLEPLLVERWAASLGATVAWRVDALDPMAEALHAGEIDVLAAGLEEKTPYAPRLALTQAYLQTLSGGRQTRRVLAVTQGENALLLSLDRFLLAQDEVAFRRVLGPVA